MCRTCERDTKARLGFGGQYAAVNMAASMKKVNVGGEKNPVGTDVILWMCLGRQLYFHLQVHLRFA